MNSKPFLAAMGVFALAPLMLAQQQTPVGGTMKVTSADTSFVTKAMQGGMAEVELGNLAQQKATNEQVKQFGQRMVTDHTKANNELKTIATSKGITEPPSLDKSDESTKDRLSRLSGADFDRAYMQDMVTDHEKDVAEFRTESQKATDPEIRAFATRTLPTLEEHLQMAQRILGELKK